MAAQSQNRGKKPAAKKNKTTSKSNTKRPTKAQEAQARQHRRETIGLLTAALAVLLMVLAILPGRAVWEAIRQAYFGMFGVCAYVFPFLLLYVAFCIANLPPEHKGGALALESVAITLMSCSVVQLFVVDAYTGKGIWNVVLMLYTSGSNRSGGGVSSILGYLLYLAMGRLPALCILLVLLVLFLLFISGTTLNQALSAVQQSLRRVDDHVTMVRQQHAIREQQREEQRAAEWERRQTAEPVTIDIPLDDEPKRKPLEALKQLFTVDSDEPEDEPPASAPKPSEAPSAAPVELDPNELFRCTNDGSWTVPDRLLQLKQQDAAKTVEELEQQRQESEDLARLIQDRFPTEQPPAAAPEIAPTPAEPSAAPQKPSKVLPWEEEDADIVMPNEEEPIYAPLPENPPEEVELTEEELFADDPSPEELMKREAAKGENAKAKLSAKEEAAQSEAQLQQEMMAQPAPPVYHKPPMSLLALPKARMNRDTSEELRTNAELLVNTLKSFGVQTRVVDISRGPTVTRYELQPSVGVKISKITNLSDDIALNLATAGVRIEAPIPNKAAVGIEVPNKKSDMVTVREVLDTDTFKNSKSPLTVALGRGISGQEVYCDLSKMPHLLIAGATGSGKSVCINTMIISLLYHSTPEEVKLLMIDPKVVELGVYNGIPHLLVPVVTDPRKAAGALGWACTEMMKRYKIFADEGVRNIVGLNKLAEMRDDLQKMPRIVVIIDELADLMMVASKEVEDSICRLAQLARAAGIHLVIATQRPSVDVITGLIKANIPSRIAFKVSSAIDSRTILDAGGAEKLLGYGDMLYVPPMGSSKPTRVQGCFVDDAEVEAVVNFIKGEGEPMAYDNRVLEEIDRQAVAEKSKKDASADDGGGFSEEDDLLPEAIELVIEAKQASTSYLQRRLKVGYARAARLMDEMEEKGIIGPFEGSKPRPVLMTRDQWIQMRMTNNDGSL